MGYTTCGEGKTQSPVDLVASEPASEPTHTATAFTFSKNYYEDVDGELFNNGQTGNALSRCSKGFEIKVLVDLQKRA